MVTPVFAVSARAEPFVRLSRIHAQLHEPLAILRPDTNRPSGESVRILVGAKRTMLLSPTICIADTSAIRERQHRR